MKLPLSIAVVAALTVLVPGTPAAARACGDAVVADWMDGRIDRQYAPSCYGDALDSLPEDVRAYTTAADDISVALQARIRDTRPPRPRTHEAAESDPALLGSPELSSVAASVPLPLLWGAAVAVLLGLAAFVWVVGRKVRRAWIHRGARPVGQW